MSIIKQIESSLVSINQAKFQDLMNHLLHLKGYDFIAAPGSVVAKEKTSKGQPDAFFKLEEGYAFAEYTTQEKIGKGTTFIQKLEKDVHACFNEKDTGIAANKIKKVILACTKKISAAEFDSISKLVSDFNPAAILEVFSIQKLAFEVIDFPGLSEKYLGVTNTKSKIRTLSDFLDGTSKGIQPSLTNPFLYREEELRLATSYLITGDILIISGKAGFGKSKLATIIANDFGRQGLIPMVIESSVVPLWDDLPNIFHSEKSYIVIFDDANKAVNNLEYLLSYIEGYRKVPIKLIITVRDYVRDDLIKLFIDRRYNEITLDIIKDKEMSEIIKLALPVLNLYPAHVERIVAIAKGNPRVALMAAYSVQPDSDINYLKNPVMLYEKYFSKVSAELQEFKSKKPLEALAIVSFFGVLDRSSQKIEALLKENFQLLWAELWDTILILHRQELVDVYKNQVCKISDQVLATYAFYETFVNPATATIPYGKWLSTFFTDYEKRVNNTIIDINNTFGYDLIKEQTAFSLEEVVANMGTDDAKLHRFFKMFWYYRETSTLLYVKNWIKLLPEEDRSGKLVFTFKHNDYVYPSYKFDLLVRFWDDPTPYLPPALLLGLELVLKQPFRLPETLKFLTENLSYKLADFDTGLKRQNELLDLLCRSDYDDYQQKIIDGIFLKMAEVLLGWDFTEHSSSRNNEITIRSFHLVRTPELIVLRERILSRLCELLPEHKARAAKALHVYSSGGKEFESSLITEELPLIQKLIDSGLDPGNYSHCRFIVRLKNILEKTGQNAPESWIPFIDSDILKLGRLLKNDIENRMDLTREERKSAKTSNLKSLVNGKNWDELQQLLESFERISEQEDESAEWWIAAAATEILELIAEDDEELFLRAIDLILRKPLSIPIQDGHLIYGVIGKELVDPEEFYKLISEFDFPAKRFWKTNFFSALPENRITPEITEELINTFNQIDGNIYLGNFASLIKYDVHFINKKAIEEYNILTFLANRLLGFANIYRIDFGFQCVQECAKYFVKQQPLLKAIYFNQQRLDRNFDYGGEELESILDLDPGFLTEYLNHRTIDQSYLSSRTDGFNAEIIWKRADHKTIITDGLSFICDKVPYVTSFDHPANLLFKTRKNDPTVKAKMQEFLEGFITGNGKDMVKMKIVMNVIVHQFSNQLIHFLRLFLVSNNDFAIAREFQFTKGGAFTGSRVPIIQKEIDLYKQILEMVKLLPNMLDYAEHIQFWEKEIENLKREISDEQRHDFRDLFD